VACDELTGWRVHWLPIICLLWCRFYSNGQVAESAAYESLSREQHDSHNVEYEVVRRNVENETASSSCQPTAPAATRTLTEPVCIHLRVRVILGMTVDHGWVHTADGSSLSLARLSGTLYILVELRDQDISIGSFRRSLRTWLLSKY